MSGRFAEAANAPEIRAHVTGRFPCYGLESGNMVDGAEPGVDGQFFIAIDVVAFEDVDRFKARVDKLVRDVRTSRRTAGVERLLMPGEMEADFEATYRRDGIPRNDRTLSDIANTAHERGVAAPAGW